MHPSPSFWFLRLALRPGPTFTKTALLFAFISSITSSLDYRAAFGQGSKLSAFFAVGGLQQALQFSAQ